MTNQQHPITPPPELVREWNQAAIGTHYRYGDGYSEYIATQAAQWGADQELEACCEWLTKRTTSRADADQLRAARRPKRPSLKEQAQRILVENGTTLDGQMELDPDDIAILRRALENVND
jgi:hypothetical protein